MLCKKCKDPIHGRNKNARYCSITCQEMRRNLKYRKPDFTAQHKFYNPAYLETT